MFHTTPAVWDSVTAEHLNEVTVCAPLVSSQPPLCNALIRELKFILPSQTEKNHTKANLDFCCDKYLTETLAFSKILTFTHLKSQIK